MPDNSKLPKPTNVTLAGLAGMEIFREVPRDVVQMLSRQCQSRWYSADQTVLQSGDDSRDVFLIVCGSVCAIHHSLNGREVRYRDLRSGEIFGELAAIDGQARSADVVTVTDTLLTIMPETVFWDTLHNCQPFAAAVIRRLARLLRVTTERVTELSTLSVRNRIHAELLRLGRTSTEDRNTAVISPVPTHAEIASRISTHREAVTRELNDLARAGVLERQKGKLVICDRSVLVKMLSAECGQVPTAEAHRLH